MEAKPENSNGILTFKCKDVGEWEKLSKPDDSQKLVVAHFTAKWCCPCRFIAPILNRLPEENVTHAVFLEVDVDDLRDVADKYKVEAMPTIVFIKDEKELERVVGARQKELLDALKRRTSSPVDTS